MQPAYEPSNWSASTYVQLTDATEFSNCNIVYSQIPTHDDDNDYWDKQL